MSFVHSRPGAAPIEISAEVERGRRACLAALHEIDGMAAAVSAFRKRALIWQARGDVYYPAMREFASAHGLRFLAVPGDHPGAFFGAGQEASVRGVKAFIDGI